MPAAAGLSWSYIFRDVPEAANLPEAADVEHMTAKLTGWNFLQPKPALAEFPVLDQGFPSP